MRQTDIVCHQLRFSEEDESLMSYELGTHDLNLITRDHQTNPKELQHRILNWILYGGGNAIRDKWQIGSWTADWIKVLFQC